MKKLNYRSISFRRFGQLAVFLFLAWVFAADAFSQEGRLVREKIRGASLGKNVTGDVQGVRYKPSI